MGRISGTIAKTQAEKVAKEMRHQTAIDSLDQKLKKLGASNKSVCPLLRILLREVEHPAFPVEEAVDEKVTPDWSQSFSMAAHKTLLTVVDTNPVRFNSTILIGVRQSGVTS